jgi:hypothetical protein
MRNFLTHPFGDFLEMRHSVAKNAYSCNGPATDPAHGLAKILVEILRRPASVMQKPCAKERQCITQRGANIGAPSTEALVLKEISLGPLFFRSLLDIAAFSGREAGGVFC